MYSWILSDVFNVENVPEDYLIILFEPLETNRITVIADSHFVLDQNRGPELVKAHNDTQSIMYFEGKENDFDTRYYPYTNMRLNQEGFSIDVRTGEWTQ